jgi:uncharacterized membrane protein
MFSGMEASVLPQHHRSIRAAPGGPGSVVATVAIFGQRDGMTDPPEPEPQPGSGQSDVRVAHVLGALRDQLGHLERLVGPEVRAAQRVERHVEPAWQRATAGENRLPVAAVIAAAIVLQVILPRHLAFKPTWLLPVLEVLLAIGLIAANPRRIDRTSTALRAASLALIALISLANAWSSGKLVNGLLNGTEGDNAHTLLASGAIVYLTNIIVFALWYWEWDRGGPVARKEGLRRYPDFMFPQMAQPDLAPPDWEPTFLDYLYTSFTNATAFSPTDTMPLSRWAKMLMLLQSAVSLLTVALVIARAVNVLK